MLNWCSFGNVPVCIGNLVTQGVVVLLVALIVSDGQLNLTRVGLIAVFSVIIFAMIDYIKIYYGQLSPINQNSSFQITTPTKAGFRTTQPVRPVPSGRGQEGKKVKFNRQVQTLNQWGHFSHEALRGQTCLDD